MKKLVSIFLSFVVIVSLSGCLEKRVNVKPHINGISFDAKISYNNENCNENCDVFISINKENEMEIKFNSPENLNGLTANYSSDKVTLKFNDIEYNVDIKSLPSGVILNYIYEIIKDTSHDDAVVIYDKNKYFIQGKTKHCDYKLYLDKSGFPISLEETENNINIEISNVSEI